MFFRSKRNKNRTIFQAQHDKLRQIVTFLLISVLNVGSFVEASLKFVIFDNHVLNLVEKEAVAIPVEGLEIFVYNYLVVKWITKY